MSSDNTKRWELIKEASKVADFHKASFEIDPTVQKALIGGGIGAGLGGASALLGEDDEEEGRGSKAMRRALIGGGLGAAAGGAYGLMSDTPAAAADKTPAPTGPPQGDPNRKPTPAGPGSDQLDLEGVDQEKQRADEYFATLPDTDPRSPSYRGPGGPDSAAGPEIPAAPAAPAAPPMPVIGPNGEMMVPNADGTQMEPAMMPDGQPVRVPEGAQIMLGPDGQPMVYVTGPDGAPHEITPEEFEAANPPLTQGDPRDNMTLDEIEAGETRMTGETENAGGETMTGTDGSQYPRENQAEGGDGSGLAEGGTALQTPQGPETAENLQQQIDAVMGRMEHSRSVGAPTEDDQRHLLGLMQRQDLLRSNQELQRSRLGPKARPGPDGRMGTPDDGTGPSLDGTITGTPPPSAGSPEGRQRDADQRVAATANQAKNRLGPNAKPGPDGRMGTPDDGTGESKNETSRREEAEGAATGRQEEADRRVSATENQAKNRLGPNARPGPDGEMGTADDGTGLTLGQQKQLDDLIKLRDSGGQEKKNSWNVSSMPSPAEAINFGHRMAKQALGKSAGSGKPKKKKSKKRHRQVLVGPKGKARYVPKPEEDDEKMAALRMRSIVERGTANFFSAR